MHCRICPVSCGKKIAKVKNLSAGYYITIITRTVAKGIPPRLYESKSRSKPQTKKDTAKTTNKSCKRAIRDGDSQSKEDEDKMVTSDDSSHRAKKKTGKWCCLEQSDSEEIKVVDDDAELKGQGIKEVDDDVCIHGSSNEQEVSTYNL